MLLFNCMILTRMEKSTSISKHHMLLFNHPSDNGYYQISEFQNIICYCLTHRSVKILGVSYISKHHMLLFNCTAHFFYCIFNQISKHHMLLFNKYVNKKKSAGKVFQNIICYCLTIDRCKYI